MDDWANDDRESSLTWRAVQQEKLAFEKTEPAGEVEISEQEFFDNGVLNGGFHGQSWCRIGF